MLNVNVLYARVLYMCVYDRIQLCSVWSVRRCPRVQNGDRVNWRTVIGLPEFSLIQRLSFVLFPILLISSAGYFAPFSFLAYKIMDDSQVSTGLHSVSSSSSIHFFLLPNIHRISVFTFIFSIALTAGERRHNRVQNYVIIARGIKIY